MIFKSVALFSLLVSPWLVLGDNLSTGGMATRYWDCCSPSGSHPGKAAVNRPAKSCLKDGVTEASPNAQSGCQGGTSFSCLDYQPYVSKKDASLSYAFGARAEVNGESNFECACYAVKFSELPRKTLVVQAINDGGDVPSTNFDIQIPGGGVGMFNGCNAQFNTSPSIWGAQYGGVSSRRDCDALPKSIRKGCYWRFYWFADNPTISELKRVKCPKTLTKKSLCIRDDDKNYPEAPKSKHDVRAH